MRRTIIITVGIMILSSVGLISFYRITSEKDLAKLNFTEVKSGDFEIAVSGTGELIPERSLEIMGPNTIQNRWVRVSPLKVTDIVPEGTIVSKGDYIATLDRTNFENTLKDEITTLNDLQAKYDMKLLDTAVVLNTLRDQIRNQAFVVEGAEIAVEESKFEPPATQHHLALVLDKERRVMEQQQRLYSLNLAQNSLEIRNLKTELRMQTAKVRNYQELLAGFTIKSPSDGMVTYARDRMGVKIKAGSNINPFNPIVATLPDLSSLKSKIYVSETDVSKVKPDQPAEVKFDAFPGKSFKGRVTSVANIGEQLPNSDSKVFEVLIKLDGADPFLRPSMTTDNNIIIQSFKNVVYIPLETVYAGADNIPYVYTKDRKKQFVVLGKSNDKYVIVEDGLKSGTSIYLTLPGNSEKFTIAGSELIPIIRERNIARNTDNEKSMKEPRIIAGTGVNILPSENPSEE